MPSRGWYKGAVMLHFISFGSRLRRSQETGICRMSAFLYNPRGMCRQNPPHSVNSMPWLLFVLIPGTTWTLCLVYAGRSNAQSHPHEERLEFVA